MNLFVNDKCYLASIVKTKARYYLIIMYYIISRSILEM